MDIMINIPSEIRFEASRSIVKYLIEVNSLLDGQTFNSAGILEDITGNLVDKIFDMIIAEQKENGTILIL